MLAQPLHHQTPIIGTFAFSTQTEVPVICSDVNQTQMYEWVNDRPFFSVMNRGRKLKFYTNLDRPGHIEICLGYGNISDTHFLICLSDDKHPRTQSNFVKLPFNKGSCKNMCTLAYSRGKRTHKFIHTADCHISIKVIAGGIKLLYKSWRFHYEPKYNPPRIGSKKWMQILENPDEVVSGTLSSNYHDIATIRCTPEEEEDLYPKYGGNHVRRHSLREKQYNLSSWHGLTPKSFNGELQFFSYNSSNYPEASFDPYITVKERGIEGNKASEPIHHEIILID